jgi:hypothetical protein
MAENAISVAFEATADTAQAESQMAQMGTSIDGTMQRTAKSVNATAVQMGKTIAESFRQAGATAEEAALGYKKLGLGGEQAGREIAVAFGGTAPTAVAGGMSKAQMAAGAFQAHLETLHARALAENELFNQGLGRTGNQLRQAQASAMILERQFGIHMPRAINAMLARSELIGPLLQYAFSVGILMLFVENMDKVIGKIREAGDWLGGFTKIYKDTMAEAIKFTKEAGENIRQVAEETAKALYSEIKDRELRAKKEHEYVMMEIKAAIAVSDARIKATNDAIQAQQRLIRSLEQTKDADLGDMAALSMGAPMHENRINQLRRAREESQRLTNQLIALRTQRNKDAAALREVADQAEKAEDKKAKAEERTFAAHERHAAAALATERRHAAAAEEAATRRVAAWKRTIDKEIELRATEKRWGDFHLARLKDEQVEITNLAMKGWDPAVRRIVLDMNTMNSALGRHLISTKALVSEMQTNELPARRRIQLQYERQMAAAEGEIQALRREAVQHHATRAQMEANERAYTELTVALAQQRALALEQETVQQANAVVMQGAALLEVLGFRRAAAIVEAAWETARSIAAYATGDFWGGTMHALAAAQYIVTAAKAGGGGGAVGGYAGGAGAYGGMGGYGGESRTYMVPRGAPVGGAAGGTTINITVQGGVVGARDLAQFVGQISQNVQRGTIRLISSATLATPVTRT